MRKCRCVCAIAVQPATACRLDEWPFMNEWPECDFIVPERESATHTPDELTGWETVIFEVGDEEAPANDG